MAGFESSIGNKKFTGSPLRELDIPDANDNTFNVDEAIKRGGLKQLDENEILQFQSRLNQAEDSGEIARQIEEARKVKRSGKERLNEGARKRIEMLIGMTRLTRVATIEGTDFELQTLKSKEMRSAILAASEFDGTVQSPFEIRKQFLARSIIGVAGLDIVQFVGSSEFEARLIFIDELDDVLLNRLYDEYLILTKSAKEKYSINTDQEVKEVAADIKK